MSRVRVGGCIGFGVQGVSQVKAAARVPVGGALVKPSFRVPSRGFQQSPGQGSLFQSFRV